MNLTEQIAFVHGIKLLIVSELLLFVACFWCIVNFRIVSSAFASFFSFPLVSCYSYSIPFSNLLILLFSSLPLQSAQIFIKVGFLENTIESLAQALGCGVLFILLQLREFLCSLFSLSDCLIGSAFYFTTGLHGFHVLIGAFLFFLLLCTLVGVQGLFSPSASRSKELFMESSLGLFLSSYYWHFVDFV